jgi:hypothetical protein
MAVVLDVGKIEGQTFNSRLSSFCFVHPAQALLNPTPQLLTRDRHAPSRSLAQAISGWMRPPKPQSVPAIPFSWPTISAKDDPKTGSDQPKVLIQRQKIAYIAFSGGLAPRF